MPARAHSTASRPTQFQGRRRSFHTPLLAARARPPHLARQPRPSADSIAYRAGVPLGNLGRTLEKLRAAGFSSVVCNEVQKEAVAYGKRRDRKEREEYGVDTPKSPLQLTQVMDARTDYRADSPGPILSVSADSLGFRLVEVDVINRRAIVREAISEEAVRSRVEAEGAPERE